MDRLDTTLPAAPYRLHHFVFEIGEEEVERVRRTLYRMSWYTLYQSTSLCQELCLVLWVATNEDPSVCVIYMLSHIVFTV